MTFDMERLPEDLVMEILSRVSLSSLQDCRLVCKHWNTLMSGPIFARLRCTHGMNSLMVWREVKDKFNLDVVDPCNLQTRKLRSPLNDFNYRDFYVVGSCNGLLCLSESVHQTPIYVCNPSLGEYLTLPIGERRLSDVFDGYFYGTGFGYDPAEPDVYKVVRLYYTSPEYLFDLAFDKAEICTVGRGGSSGSWRVIDGSYDRPRINPVSHILLDGRLYWMAWRREYPRRLLFNGMVSFGIHEEEFRDVPCPSGLVCGSKIEYRVNLVSLRGCLTVVDSSFENWIDIWLMKDPRIGESWVKEYTIHLTLPQRHLSQKIEPLMILKNGDILLRTGRGLATYDPRNGDFLVRLVETTTPLVAFPYVENLNSLKEACNDGERMG
ncbi:F-box protein [Acorus gramineus]|uniref:F-box protein n=1 Tax=Acorus gramineus TaxID=55184 RepID=A0AAV9B9J8_ACOGR|nr:F-box protein [Acorus gramineus]